MKFQIYIFALCLAMIVGCNKNEAKERNNDPTGKFVVTKERSLYQADGSEFNIKGVNLNHWLTPEAYCFNFTNISVTEVDKALRQIFGDEYMDGWWKRFLDSYISDEDFVYLNSVGANTVRMPLTYKLFNDSFYLCDNNPDAGFEYIDYVVRMCREVGLYLILDMHVAPGGQSGSPNIDDSDGYPHLFENQENMDEYCRIWKRIAGRYADEPIILGYELLNEPLDKKFSALYPLLEPTFKKAAAAIREVDKNHIIIIGGGNYYDDFSMLSDYAFDSKLMLTCHRYGSTDVNKFAELSAQTNLPMFMGEFGHWNGGTDMTFQVVSNMKSKGIGYTYWPYKKMDDWESLLGFTVPEGWSSIADYVKAPRETMVQIQIALKNVNVEKAKEAMETYLENCKFGNCFERSEVREGLQFK